MCVPDELIYELADLCGIAPEYWDIFGARHEASLESRKAVLSAMGLNIASPEDIKKEIGERQGRPWKCFLDPVFVFSVNSGQLMVPVYLPLGDRDQSRLSLVWSLEDEHGNKEESALSGDALVMADERWIDGTRYLKINISFSGKLDIGYYSLTVTAIHAEGFPGIGDTALTKNSRLILTPDACYIPPELEEGKTWGISLNLYSMRSSRNWGVGDFGDLKEITKWVARLNGGFVGINPLHAIPNKKPFGISPYSPISRLYKNFIYLELKSPKPGPIAAELKELRMEDLIDYRRAACLKKQALRFGFDRFHKRHYLNGSSQGMDFKSYISEEGEPLDHFAAYMALADHFGTTGENSADPCYSWQEWPPEYHDHKGREVCAFKQEQSEDILFYKYVQWLIDRQLGEIAGIARKNRMPVGLYHDLAIGSISGGSDTWSFRGLIAAGADVGAPPDDFNINGQNWGFPPLIPEKLRQDGYEFLIQTIRKNMKHGGAIRIDHALGMFRLFWIPRGRHASEGAYVRYPSEDILRIIALESVRNRTMVIAEDLGTVGDNVREDLLRFRMLSYKLLYFERNYPDPSFRGPEEYPEMSLCSVTTHDLPTLCGYWAGRDMEVKRQLGIYTDADSWQRDIDNRDRDRALVISALAARGIRTRYKTVPSVMTPGLCLAVYEYLSQTPAKLLSVSLDDAIGTMDQQNMPGVTDAYPSWMQKTPVLLERIVGDKWFARLAEIFRKNNR